MITRLNVNNENAGTGKRKIASKMGLNASFSPPAVSMFTEKRCVVFKFNSRS